MLIDFREEVGGREGERERKGGREERRKEGG